MIWSYENRMFPLLISNVEGSVSHSACTLVPCWIMEERTEGTVTIVSVHSPWSKMSDPAFERRRLCFDGCSPKIVALPLPCFFDYKTCVCSKPVLFSFQTCIPGFFPLRGFTFCCACSACHEVCFRFPSSIMKTIKEESALEWDLEGNWAPKSLSFSGWWTTYQIRSCLLPCCWNLLISWCLMMFLGKFATWMNLNDVLWCSQGQESLQIVARGFVCRRVFDIDWIGGRPWRVFPRGII